jgi:hypothetical protein
MIAIVFSLAILASPDDSVLSLADLEAYRLALASRPGPSVPLITFRELWDRPEAYQGQPVRVEGRVARLFRQPKLGEFPPLVEAWVVSPAGDPFCIVFPGEAPESSPEIGRSVQFTGTFVRKIRYQGGDTARVVPLIVGPEKPQDVVSSIDPGRWSWTSIDWMMGLGATLILTAILVGRHLSRPAAPPRDREPYPIFIDGEPEGGVITDEAAH